MAQAHVSSSFKGSVTFRLRTAEFRTYRDSHILHAGGRDGGRSSCFTNGTGAPELPGNWCGSDCVFSTRSRMVFGVYEYLAQRNRTQHAVAGKQRHESLSAI